MVQPVSIRRTVGLEQYGKLMPLGEPWQEVRGLAGRVSRLLGSRRIVMLSATETGGGVAETLPRLIELLSSLGLDVRWLVLKPTEPAFFRVTKELHNLLHGDEGLTDLEAARALYETVSESMAAPLRQQITPSDILVVHDPQPVGAAAALRPHERPLLLWRCHIGVPFQNENTRRGWEFLRPYLAPFARLLFSAQAYIPDEYRARGAVLLPSIDPLSEKNRELHRNEVVGIVSALGLADGLPVTPWAHFKYQALVFSHGRWKNRPIQGLLEKPAIVQVSRFDRLKGFQFLIPAFESLIGPHAEQSPLFPEAQRVRSVLHEVQLVLAGPDPTGVPDDPEAALTLEKLCQQQSALPPEVQRRVHLVRLPMADREENALGVNALQRLATVVVQNSLQEGFGLTATEALWKRVPLVASNVGGLAEQIRDGREGLLVDEPRRPEAVAERLLKALAFPDRAEAMAASGQNRVRERYLVIAEVKRWLEEIQRLVSGTLQPGQLSFTGAAA